MHLHGLTCAARAVLAIVWLAGAAMAAVADPQSKSWSHWEVEPEHRVRAIFSITSREATRLTRDTASSALAAAWRNHLAQVVRLSAPEAACQLLEVASAPAAPDYQRAALTWQCKTQPAVLDLALPVFAGVTSGHVHFATLTRPDGSTTERLFTYAQPQHQLPLLNTATDNLTLRGWTQVLPSYIRFGFEHILVGIDHIAFLLTLMLLSGRWRHLLWIITGFTLGHSITLSLAALDLVSPRIALVEALIGLTIAITAVENVVCRNGHHRGAAWLSALALLGIAAWDMLGRAALPPLTLPGLALFCYCYFTLSDSEPRALQLRPAITVLFGLVHGFGFASVLLEVGLPAQSRLPALVGFNLGVEIGQLVIVGALAMVAWPLRKFRHRWAAAGADWLSAALCGLGLFWFVQRLYL